MAAVSRAAQQAVVDSPAAVPQVAAAKPVAANRVVPVKQAAALVAACLVALRAAQPDRKAAECRTQAAAQMLRPAAECPAVPGRMQRAACLEAEALRAVQVHKAAAKQAVLLVAFHPRAATVQRAGRQAVTARQVVQPAVQAEVAVPVQTQVRQLAAAVAAPRAVTLQVVAVAAVVADR